MASGLFCAAVLSACGDDNGASSSEPNGSSASENGKVIYSVINKKVETKGNPARPDQGLWCFVAMQAENKTDMDISLLQIMKFTAITSKGDLSDHGANMRLDQGEAETFSAGIGVDGVACEDVQKVIIQQVFCHNSDRKPGDADYECLENVVFKGSKKIKIEVEDSALKPRITVTP